MPWGEAGGAPDMGMSDPHPVEASAKPGGSGRGAWRRLGVAVAGGGCALLTTWATAALYFDVRVPGLGALLAGLYAVAVLAMWIVVKRRGRAVLATLGAFALVLAWWLSLRPSNDRAWQPDVAVLPYAEIAGSRVTVRHIRHCDYRTETDFAVRHYDRAFDLDGLRTVDLFMVYWGSPHMAHTMVSFGFVDGAYLCFSIETRKEAGEEYSAVKGLFRQFELTYVVADERDVVRLRTNYRQGEDVYLFRLNATPAQAREFFLSYVHTMNELAREPRWYNAVTNNCTLGIRLQRAVSDRAPWDWRMLVNGHGDEMLYERGMISTSLPLAETKRRALVNPRAQAAGAGADFSQAIRRGLPEAAP
jgi:hypothetical protein